MASGDGPRILRSCRRVRHLTNVTARGIQPPAASGSPLALACFYTLEDADADGGAGAGGGPYYTSPLATPSTCPHWPPVDPASFDREPPPWSAREVRARVYGVVAAGLLAGERPPPAEERPRVLLLEETVDVAQLRWLRPAQSTTLPEVPPSSLLWVLDDGVYASQKSEAASRVAQADADADASGLPAPSLKQQAWKRERRPAAAPRTVTEKRRAKNCATASQALDLVAMVHDASEAARAAEATVARLGADVEAALVGQVPRADERQGLLAWRERLAEAEATVAGDERALRRERADLKRAQHARENAANALSRSSGLLSDERARAESHLAEKALGAAKSRLADVTERLAARRRRFVHLLSGVYPINRLGAGGGAATSSSHEVRGIRIPPPSQLSSVEDEQLSTALGYAAHLMLMLSKHLGVPLRYRIVHRGSRSAVRDDVHSSPEYPLYARGEDTRRLERAYLLLAENADQLLVARAAQLGRPAPKATGSVLGTLHEIVSMELG